MHKSLLHGILNRFPLLLLCFVSILQVLVQYSVIRERRRWFPGKLPHPSIIPSTPPLFNSPLQVVFKFIPFPPFTHDALRVHMSSSSFSLSAFLVVVVVVIVVVVVRIC